MPKAKVIALVGLIWPAMGSANMISHEGSKPFEICALCHSLDGNSRMAKFPKLAGQPAPYIEKQLLDFLEGRRTNDGGQMVSIVTEIASTDFSVVAAWFADQQPPEPADQADVASGQKVFVDLGCAVCHGADQISDTTPHLTAQHAGYLVKQMTDFRDGNRGNDLDGAMQAAMRDVSDADIQELAKYLAATPRDSNENR